MPESAPVAALAVGVVVFAIVLAVVLLSLRIGGLSAELARSEADRDRLEDEIRALLEDDELEDAAFRAEIEDLRRRNDEARKKLRARARPGDGLAALRLLSRGRKAADRNPQDRP